MQCYCGYWVSHDKHDPHATPLPPPTCPLKMSAWCPCFRQSLPVYFTTWSGSYSNCKLFTASCEVNSPNSTGFAREHKSFEKKKILPPRIFPTTMSLKELVIQCIVGYCYKYTRATYDWFCGPGSCNIIIMDIIPKIWCHGHKITPQQYNFIMKWPCPSCRYIDFSLKSFESLILFNSKVLISQFLVFMTHTGLSEFMSCFY